jgi:hypothetical protein
MLIVSLDQYNVVVAFTEIGRELGYSAHVAVGDQRVCRGVSGFLMLGGRGADVLARRRIFVAGLALYAGALAGRRTRDGAGAAGLVIGVLLGGVLRQKFGWEAVFFVNVPLAALAGLLAFSLMERARPPEITRTFDLPGALSATLGVILLVFALVEGPNLGWASPGVMGSAGLGLSPAGRARAHRAAESRPLLPARLLANRSLAPRSGSRDRDRDAVVSLVSVSR